MKVAVGSALILSLASVSTPGKSVTGEVLFGVIHLYGNRCVYQD